jgi:hypothetical protein
MTQHALLSNVEHKDLRVITARGKQYGDEIMYAFTFPAEFRNVQAYYPIVFAKTPDGAFSPLALFGFHQGQNLFLKDGKWDATYLPVMVERQPFLIGNAPNGKVIHIDLDHPRVNRGPGDGEGQRVFLEHGGSTEYLEHISKVLGYIDESVAATPAFVAALLEHDLLESFALDIQFSDGKQHRFEGFHAISEDKLRKLDGAALGKLHERGYLQALFMAIASLSKFRDLIERANNLNAADR